MDLPLKSVGETKWSPFHRCGLSPLHLHQRGGNLVLGRRKRFRDKKGQKALEEKRGALGVGTMAPALSLVGQVTSPARLWMKAVKVVDQQIAPSSARYCRRPSCDWPLLPTEPHSWRTHWPGVRLCKVSAQIWQFPNFHAQCKSWTFSESIKI